jgi:hypothetical protein
MVRIARLEEQRAMRRSLPAPETVSGEVVEARSLTSGLANPAGWLTEAMGTYTAPSGPACNGREGARPVAGVVGGQHHR